MHPYRVALLVTSLALVCLPTAARAPRHHPAKKPTFVAKVRPASHADQLYSSRALRRARTILQLRLLELRKQHLDRVRQIIERRLPVDTLFDDPPQ